MLSDLLILRVLSIWLPKRSQDKVNHVFGRLCWDPIWIYCLSANSAFFGDIRVVDFREEFDLRGLEREIVTEVDYDDEFTTTEFILTIDNHFPLENIILV